MTTPTPALVSGPGALSRRTDNGQPIRSLPDAKYGENKALVEQQRAAPLADGPDRPSPPPPGAMVAQGSPAQPQAEATPPPEIVPLSAPSQYPSQPVTTGMQTGMNATRPREPQFTPGQLSEALRPYAVADDSGVLNELIWQLTDQGL